MRDVEVNVAYRCFLGYTLPHFATIGDAFRHRFTAEVIEGAFRGVLEEVARAGYLSPEIVFVKANANLKKHVKKSYRRQRSITRSSCCRKWTQTGKRMGKAAEEG